MANENMERYPKLLDIGKIRIKTKMRYHYVTITTAQKFLKSKILNPLLKGCRAIETLIYCW